MLSGYYFITDAKLSKDGNLSDVKAAIKAGVKVVQYRNKTTTTKDMLKEALQLKAICKNGKALFLINDRVDIALAVCADGVHLGNEDMPYKTARRLLGRNRIIGLTAHNVKEARDAEKSGANYIGVSPVFMTDTKPDAGVPAGIELVRKIKKAVSIPIVAIGGIDLYNAEEVIKAGADGLCAISAVVTKSNVRKEIEKFQKLWYNPFQIKQ
ncbi:MAG: thiamine phosphate synthase [Candidatus Omnitrophica bacterium]|nr:thiamine phosphate synthase [Candidatus Omnitrophota bacterium]